LHQFGYKAWVTIELSLDIAILDDNVFPLDITEISQSLLESLDRRPGSLGTAPVGDTYPIRGTFPACWASAGKESARSMA